MRQASILHRTFYSDMNQFLFRHSWSNLQLNDFIVVLSVCVPSRESQYGSHDHVSTDPVFSLADFRFRHQFSRNLKSKIIVFMMRRRHGYLAYQFFQSPQKLHHLYVKITAVREIYPHLLETRSLLRPLGIVE